MTSKQAEDKANERYTWQIKTLLNAGLTDDQADSIIELLDEAHAAGRREALEKKETPHEYVRGYEQGIRVGRREAIAEVMPTIEYYTHAKRWYCQHDDSSWCDETCGDGGKRARALIERLK